MKKIRIASFVFLSALVLSGCIGENYKFYPPSVSVGIGMFSKELVETNSNWRGEGNKSLVKETEDWFAYAEKLPSIHLLAGDEIDFSLEHWDYLLHDTDVTLWTLEKEKVDLYIKEVDSVTLPTAKGEYILEFQLDTDAGDSQYVGHIILE